MRRDAGFAAAFTLFFRQLATGSMNRLAAGFALALAVAGMLAGNSLIAQSGDQQLAPGRNVNMVGGPIRFNLNPPVSVEEGDPFLQRQNEPSCAVMNRNPLRIFCGANDYRTVDVPGLPEHRFTGDAWLGVFTSTDGGETWRTRLVPGFPQDKSPEGQSSPIYGLGAGADATVRAGVGDIIYYSGIAFNRDDAAQNNQSTDSSSGFQGKKGVLFVARYNDPNLPHDPEPFRYLDTRVVDSGSEGRFLDKPWLAVDGPRPWNGTCTIQVPGATAQTIPAGNAYLAYAVFVGNDNNIRTKIYAIRSTDCGQTWTNRTKLSEGYPVNQGVSIGIDPRTGWVYIVWRRFRTDKNHDAFLYVVSKDGGRTYTQAQQIVSVPPLQLADGSLLSPLFDQASTSISARTVAFPSIAVGDSGVDGQPGPVYVTWSQRWQQGQNGIERREARVVVATGTPTSTGLTWSAPTPVHNPPEFLGHQFQPSASVVSGRLAIAYVNLQETHTVGTFTAIKEGAELLYRETRQVAGDLAPAPGEPEKVFNDFMADAAQDEFGKFTIPLKRRQTVDTWLSWSPVASNLSFTTVRVSSYPFGLKNERLEQLQYNPPNFKLFSQGTAAFIGDYIDIGRRLFRPSGGVWPPATSPSPDDPPVFYITWTDNRDVRPPAGGDWTNYTPPVYAELGGQSVFDPSQMQPVCEPTKGSRAGMRNQNVYASRVTEGLFVSSLTNQKPLKTTSVEGDIVDFVVDQHVFPVQIENETNQTRTFRAIVTPDPTAPDPTAVASFDQFSELTQIDLKIFRTSSVSRNVFVKASNPKASFKVEVFEIPNIGAPDPTAGGLRAVTILNPDPTAPDPTAPDPTAPDPTAFELYNVDLAAPDPTATNVDVSNTLVQTPDPTAPDPTADTIAFPDPTAPDPTAPDPTAPDPTAPDPTATDVVNTDVAAPDPTAPDPTAPDPTASALTDTVSTVTNTGNNTAVYKVKLFLNKPLPTGFHLQLILNKFYATPAVQACDPATRQNAVVVAAIPNPTVVTDTADLANPDPTATGASDASITLESGETGYITARLFDPNRANNVSFVDPATGRKHTLDPNFNPARDVETVVIPPVNNVDEAQGITEAEIATTFLYITTSALPTGRQGTAYSAFLRASGGEGQLTWALLESSLPDGLVLNAATGQISGTPTVTGTFPISVQVTDSASPVPQVATRALSITIVEAGVASLSFVQQPTDAEPGAQITPAITVRALDANGAALAGVSVTMTIGANPGGGTLSGTTTVLTASNGVATFPNLSIDKAGSGYTLVAGGAGFASATSVPFNVGVFTVTNTNDSGAGSLRQAILNANANGNGGMGFDTITFPIPGPGPHTIAPTSPLPTITEAVLIDAPVTGDCAGAPPTVEIDGSGAGNAHGLVVSTNGAVIRGLSITNFQLAGVFLAGGGFNVVECSYLGLAPDGVTVKGNGAGVRISGSSNNNTIGGATAAVRNVISGNLVKPDTDGNGIAIASGSSGNQILGNFIGTDSTGTVDKGNAAHGVVVVDATNNTINGNVVSGNNGEGVGIYGANATGNLIQNNRIGTNAAGTAALGNSASGVYIRRAPANVVEGNQVSGNIGFAGVAICGNAEFCGGGNLGTQTSNASGNILRGNLIGTNAAGSGALGNLQRGVSIDGAPNTSIGGTTTAERNVISGNGTAGVHIFAAGATGNLIRGNYIGTNAAGTVAVANGQAGILISGASGNTIGGTTGNTPGGACTGACNLISGNAVASQRAGVFLENGATNNLVQGNYIGTNASGTGGVGNWWGINIQSASGNTIGGSTAEARNLISGNVNTGVRISGADSNVVKGNYIGVDRTGAAPLGNGNQGLRVDNGVGNVVGGGAIGEGNVISANGSEGVRLLFSSTLVQGNFIGTDASGTVLLGNGLSGVAVFANRGGNRITRNAIADNGGLGIDLDVDGDHPPDGVTPNDDDDPDTGPNDLQNFPVLDQATDDGEGDVTVRGSLNSTPSTSFTIDFYHSTTCDPSGHGEGQTWVGSHDGVTNSAGNLSFAETGVQLTGVPAGGFITATATNPAGSTSEFSACRGVVDAPPESVAADVTIAPVGAAPALIAGQSYNEERTADITVVSASPLRVNTMVLSGLNIAEGASGTVTAKIYDSAGALLAQAAAINVGAGAGRTVSILIPETTLASGARYRVGFLVETSTGTAGSGTFFDRTVSGFPYDGDPAGKVRVESAQSNGNPNFAVPQMRLLLVQ